MTHEQFEQDWRQRVMAKVIAFRVEHGLSIRALSRMTGMSNATICRIERGVPVTHMTLGKIEKFVDERMEGKE